ncbi:MAG TPA: ATP-binding protein [Burkholderiales bacterium]|nr:ATP-binding protein [Burkholderiales bacterium]
MTARQAFTLKRAPAPRAGAAAPSASTEWYWAMPELAVIFFVLAIIAFLWIADRQEREQRRHALIGDILWLEQNIRFHLQSNEDLLALLAREVADGRLGEEGFRLRASSLLANNPELTRVALVDAAGAVRAVVPGHVTDWRVGQALPGNGIAETLKLAVGGGRRVYDDPRTFQGERGFAVVVPATASDGRVAVVAAYSLGRILGNLVPWWFAQKYHVSVLDSAGEVISSKSGIPPVGAELFYQLPLDPPGRGMTLRATAYPSSAGFGERMFTWVVLGLTVVILWSLWMLRRHVLRRELAEAALRASHERFMTVLEGLDAAVSVHDPETRESLYCNGRFRALFGPEATEGGYCPLLPWQRAADPVADSLDADLQDPASGRWYHLQRRPVRWVDERMVQLEVATDITERKEAEEMSRQQMEKLQFTARLVTMGEMASTLAHELNQPLSAIASYNTGCLNTLRSGNGDPEQLLEAVEKVGLQAQRAGRIIKGIHEFVRKSEPRRAPCDLNAVVEEAVGFIQPEARKRGVQVELRLAADLPGVMADHVMLEQVVMNLAKNAVEAMSGGERRELTVTTSRTADGQARVSVSDTGPGIAQSLRDKLFAPFFTTKAEGMGMGLNICRSIIEYHQGRLWLEPNPGGGSVFSFTLPA